MARKLTSRTVRYFRSVYDGEPRDLQNLILQARRYAPSCAESEIVMDGVRTVFIQHYRAPRNASGCFVHLSSFNTGDKAKIVKPQSSLVEDDGADQSARRYHEFVAGECYLNVKGSNVLFCSHGISKALCVTYFRKLFHSSGIDPESYRFDLTSVGDVAKLELLQRHGVKSIDLSCSVFEMSRRELAPASQTWGGRVWSNVYPVFDSFIGQDDSVAEQRASEDLIVNLSVKLSGATRADIEAQESIKTMATDILTDESDELQGFTITTMNDEKLTQSEISFSKKVTVERQSNFLDYDSVFSALSTFRVELETDNLLEQ